jgi:hypothetical protein
MTKRPHDALFKAAFERPSHAAQLLRGLLPADLAAAIAWDTLSLRPGSFVDEQLDDTHTDLLFSVDAGGTEVLVYVLLEHQSKVDPQMPTRMHEYVVQIWAKFRGDHSTRHQPPVIPIVLSHAPGGWTEPTTLWDFVDPHPTTLPGLAPFVPSFSILVHDFSEWTDDEIKRRVLAAFPRLALWALRDARDPDRLVANLQRWAATLLETAKSPSGMRALAQLVRYVWLVLDPGRYRQFRATLRQLAPDVEEAVMTILEELREEGRKEGRKEGLVEGAQGMLLKQLRHKFGALTEAQIHRLRQADEATLDSYAERVMTADSIEAVLGTD